MNKKFIIIIFIALFTQNIWAKENCVFFIMGGAKDWMTILPKLVTDISISVDAGVREQAEKSGCDVITTSNDSPEDFKRHLTKLKKYKTGTKFHFALTDHGAPPDMRHINGSWLTTGMGQFISYHDFFSTLKATIPSQSHVTFHVNTCYPGMSDAILANKLEDHFSICASSSTMPDQMSMNLHEMEKFSNGYVRGPYGVLGLDFANSYKKRYGKAPSLLSFHLNGRKGDIGNLKRQPGMTTSMTFAMRVLQKNKMSLPLGHGDLEQRVNIINWKDRDALEKFLRTTNDEIAKNIQIHLDPTCQEKAVDPFGKFLSGLTPVYLALVEENNQLPPPYNEYNAASKKWLKEHKKEMSALLAKVAKEKAEFINKNKLYPREKYVEIELAWQNLSNRHSESLREYDYHLRQLQEGKLLNQFFASATPAERERFNAYHSCEQKPMF